MTTNTTKENYTSEVEKSSEDKLTEMQTHLITNVGLSIGVISTIIFVTKTKAFISSYLRVSLKRNLNNSVYHKRKDFLEFIITCFIAFLKNYIYEIIFCIFT